MGKGIQNKLKLAQSKQTLIQFPLPHEDGWSTGYVAGLEDKWLVLNRVSEDIYFNGFECHRISDLRHVTRKAPYRKFIETALRLLEQTKPADPLVDPTSTRSLLLTANKQYPLIVIHRELKEPGTCLIGRVLNLKRKRLSLRCIKPGAVWDDAPETIKLKHITRIDFAGGYEDALHQVGGDAPRR